MPRARPLHAVDTQVSGHGVAPPFCAITGGDTRAWTKVVLPAPSSWLFRTHHLPSWRHGSVGLEILAPRGHAPTRCTREHHRHPRSLVLCHPHPLTLVCCAAGSHQAGAMLALIIKRRDNILSPVIPPQF